MLECGVLSKHLGRKQRKIQGQDQVVLILGVPSRFLGTGFLFDVIKVSASICPTHPLFILFLEMYVNTFLGYSKEVTFLDVLSLEKSYHAYISYNTQKRSVKVLNEAVTRSP